ncbi:hypothetical protein [Lysobacter solisilvae (ex Woo and Kim 2020)]|uniref:Uncharacterized protein n=1 Tax=Agrilutibacter terrestris TaxID=2865112 RepID=A0A7H0FY93_9GAMM|nr:hypothetical protein [Lysobacter terrestris]QNP41009.1 hypothetical protein H8B22_01825 [Lysobacter terrestris]
MHSWVLAIGLMFACGGATAGNAPAPAIVLEPLPPTGELLELWAQPGPVPAHLQAQIDLGDDAGGRVLRLIAPDDKPGNYRVSVQFETSAGISGEGPHVDLIDWKHCRSDWHPAADDGEGGFRLPFPDERDQSCFPPATRGELRTAVHNAITWEADAAARARWLDLAAQAPRIGEAPSYVAISLIRVRVEYREAGAWRLLTVIDLLVPMGC